MTNRFDSTFDYYFDKPLNQLLPDLANSNASGKWRPCQVGSYKPTKLGLYDMHGNVWEWCEDEVKVDNRPSLRVVRSDAWDGPPERCRTSSRIVIPRSDRHGTVGLRVARVSDALRPLFRTLPGRPWLVTEGDGTSKVRYQRFLYYLKRIVNKLGLAGRFHTFRHSFISKSLTGGTPEAIVRSWVGDVDAEIMKLCTHNADRNSQAAMKRLAR